MKIFFLSLCLLILGSNVGLAMAADHLVYENPDIGVSFQYPSTVAIDHKQSTQKPLRVAFQYGTPPFALHILFKEIPKHEKLDTFIQEERGNQEQGGYRHEVTESHLTIGNNIQSIRFLRKSPFGDMHYIVFQSPSLKKLFGFWHVTSRGADPNKKAVDALETMLRSLRVE